MKAPAEEVLSALTPLWAEPQDGRWSGMGNLPSAQRSAEMGMSPRWQIFYAIVRIWWPKSTELSDDSRVRIGHRLLDFLPRSQDKKVILYRLPEFWTPEAEPIFVPLLSSTDRGEVVLAAQTLSQHVGNKYHEPILKALRAPLSDARDEATFRQALLEALLEPRLKEIAQAHPARKAQLADFDFAAIEAGFNLLQQLEARHPGDGYFIADILGSALSQQFAPDQNLPQYQGEHGLTDAFFSDTSCNALAWWKAHRNGNSKDLQP